MKYAAILMILVLIVSLAGVGYLYMTANVTIEVYSVAATEASVQPELFASLARQVEEGAVIGACFTDERLGDASSYQFLTYTVRVKNNCFLPADMVEVQVTPMTGDALQIGAPTAYALPARSVGDIQATILTDISMHSIREVVVTYYIWGLPFSLKTTSGAAEL